MRLPPSFDAPRTAALALVAALTVAGCGGGGGGATDAPVTPANKPPVAAAKVVGESVVQQPVTLDASASTDPEGGALTAVWAYGDGQSGSASTHTYAKPGSYTATVTVTDAGGLQSTASVPVTVAKCSAAGTAASGLSPHPTVCMQTSKGEVVVEVFPAQAPLSAANFLRYVEDGFYDGLVFHRVIKDFVVQGGGFLPGMTPKAATYAPIALESANGLQNWAYTLAMARTNVANSATSQFYVNLVNNHGLDYNAAVPTPNGYAVFGQVIAGQTVIDAIGASTTASVAGYADVPQPDVVIRTAQRLK